MKTKLVTLVIAGLIVSPTCYAINIYQDDENSVSLRGYLRLTMYGDEDNEEITDSGSRWGFDLTRKIQGDWTAGITMEWATNFEKNKNLTIGGDSSLPSGDAGDSLSSRLGYLNFTHKNWGSIGIGKQWSVYYDVVGVTDVLNYFGGNATGVYNLGTDGGLSGTGRSEQALTWRNSYKNLSVGIQIQAQDEAVTIQGTGSSDIDGTEIAVMGNGIAGMVSYDWGNFTLGAAFSKSKIDISPVFGNLGVEDEEDSISALALTYGTNGEGLYMGLTAASSEYHETDNTNSYIDAVGSELYVKYTLDNQVGIYGGFNLLESDESQNDFEMFYNYAGVEIPFINGVGITFLEVKLNDNTNHDNTDGIDDTEVAIGVTIFI